jgi:hypothetical protein
MARNRAARSPFGMRLAEHPNVLGRRPERRQTRRYAVGAARVDARRLPLPLLRSNVAQRVLDVSAGGARLLLTHPLEVGASLRVRVEFPGRDVALDTAADVVWSTGFSRQRHHIVGVAFRAHPALVARILERAMRQR